MQKCFVSVVTVLQHGTELSLLPQFLPKLSAILAANFSDFEIILINNTNGLQPASIILSLPADIRKNVHLLHLSAQINRNNAIFAGLDRANGDYTVILEMDFSENLDWVSRLYEKTQEGYDIVYLRASGKQFPIRFQFLHRLFYFILRQYSPLKVDELAHDTRIISRRALNSLLRLRENLRYLKAIYSIVGYRTAFLQTNQPLQHDASASFSEQFRTSLVAITSFTTFLRTVTLWIFLISSLFAFLAIFNAFKVKLTNVDIFGDYHEALSGWAFLVVIISGFFAITFLNLYILSIYLSNIYHEIKQRPLYIIESIQRF